MERQLSANSSAINEIGLAERNSDETDQVAARL
jgi:hypothetical protein